MEQVASAPAGARIPLAGLVLPLCRHDSPRLRIAALRMLAQTEGFPARQAVVTTLQDSDESVHLAAVEVLETMIRRDPSQWLHPLFNQHPSVRRHALQVIQSCEVRWPTVFLLDDPDADAHTVLDLLRGQSLPAFLLTTILDFRQDGRISAVEAVRLLNELHWSEVAKALPSLDNDDPASDPSIQEALRKTMESRQSAPLLHLKLSDVEVFVHLLELVLSVFPAEAETLVEKLQSRLRSPVSVRLRIGLAALRVARHQPRLDILRLLFLMLPEALACSDLPGDRRTAALVYYQTAERTEKRPSPWVIKLIESCDLCRRPKSGALDLEVIGGLLYMVGDKPYSVFVKHFGESPVVTAALEDVHATARFLCHPDDSIMGHKWLIDRISQKRGTSKAVFYALLAVHLPTQRLDLLSGLELGQLVPFLETLFSEARTTGTKLTDAKISRITDHVMAPSGESFYTGFIRLWLKEANLVDNALARSVFTAIARRLETTEFTRLVLKRPQEEILRLLTVIPDCPGIPFGKEMALAHGLARSSFVELRDWARERTGINDDDTDKELFDAPDPAQKISRFFKSELKRIRTCRDKDLENAVRSVGDKTVAGLCEALSKRPAFPSHVVCLALLRCADQLVEIDREFHRWSRHDAVFMRALDAAMVSRHDRLELNYFGHAWLHLWEKNCFALGAAIVQTERSLAAHLRMANSWQSPVLGEQLWRALARLLSIEKSRHLSRFSTLVDNDLVHLAVDELTRRHAVAAARILLAIFRSRLFTDLIIEARQAIREVLPDIEQEARDLLRPIISAKGLTLSVKLLPRKDPQLTLVPKIPSETSDVGELLSLLLSEDPSLVSETSARLIELGEFEAITSAFITAESIVLWHEISAHLVLWPDHEPALARLRTCASDKKLDPALRYYACRGLLQRAEMSFEDTLYRSLHDATSYSWFTRDEWNRLKEVVPERRLSLALATSPHPHAHRLSVESLVLETNDDPEVASALVAFLECEGPRLHELRVWAADWLHLHGYLDGMPVLFREAFENAGESFLNLNPDQLFAGLTTDLALVVLHSALAGGRRFCDERLLAQWILHHDVPPEVKDVLVPELFEKALDNSARSSLILHLRRQLGRNPRLRVLADTFAWGVRVGRELTGSVFRIDMPGDESLGYTRLSENRIWITPLLIMRRDHKGITSTKGLIVHEFGHHLYHRGQEQEAIWQKADQEGIGRLLNLVADEHLERNLRSERAEFGDYLKTLGAHAFQRSNRTIEVEFLLRALRRSAFSVLIRTPLFPARKPGCVTIESGRVLAEMERQGMSFARFFRALRLGLGNRHADPLVEQGLELFKDRFRHSSMDDLYTVTRKLREIFGEQCDLLSMIGEVHDERADEWETVIRTGGLTGDELQSEIQRILKARGGATPSKSGGGKGGVRILNDGTEEAFSEIPTVTPIPFDPAAYREYASSVARPARRLREFFERLGLSYVPVGPRLSGRAIDRTRIMPLIVRREPRIMMTRHLQFSTDLFIGVVIDCSGSMDIMDNIEHAKRFGALIAEATRGLHGIEARFWGFTHAEIYDAGDNRRCAVHGLQAAGGNNDAAALWHAAQSARQSKRRAKVLVMISDGLPTECTTTSLRGLVDRLTRRDHMCCAQVAVQPIQEVCFPHYVEIRDKDENQSVKQFGQIVAKLVHQQLKAK